MSIDAARHTPVLDGLRALVGDALRTDTESLEAARADRSGQVSAGVPLAVIEATTIEHV